MTILVKASNMSANSPQFRQRGQRLLDAAQSHFVRFGFDKTTIAEIAKGAGVSKGAVYLHFKSKEALFEALLRRELRRFNELWLTRVETDPLGGTISGMFKNLLLALRESAFTRAIFKNDVSVLGSYLQNPNGLFRKPRRHHTRREFVERMQAAGGVRPDLDAKVTAHILNMISFALVAMDDAIPSDDPPDFDALIEGIGDLLERALTPPGGGNTEAGKTILRELSEAARQRDSAKAEA